MIKLCIFDCDGTLVDGLHAITTAMGSAFIAAGLPPPAGGAIRRVVGLALGDAIALLHPGAAAETCAALSRHYVTAFGDLRRAGQAREPLFPGVAEGLEAIEDAGWLLGIATGKSRRGALATLASHDLHERFVTVQTADVAAGKPAPEMIHRALAETGAACDRAVMIGDTTFDIQMARNAGIVAIGVAWGYHDRAELVAAGAAAIVEEFAALPATIEDLMARAAA